MNSPMQDTSPDDVVVTGLGIVSPYGRGCEAYWHGLSQGRCILGPIHLFPTAGFRSCIGGEVEADVVGALSGPSHSRANSFLSAAAAEAVTNAGLEAEHLATAAVSIGGAGGGMLDAETWYWHYDQYQTDGRYHTALRSMVPAAQTTMLAAQLHIGGPQESPILACSSSAASLVTIADLIATGVVDVGLAGGVDTLTRLCFMGFNALKLLDTRPCRPFARDRRGMSLGEGAAVLVLESRRHAMARGAPVHAVLAGCGITSDAFHPTAPAADAEGAIRAMRQALHQAHLPPDEITYVNAHGTGTVHNDRIEALALQEVFGPEKVLVSATKSLIGHAMGATGALEATATVLALQAGVIPPTANLDEVDPAIPFDCVPHVARAVSMHSAMSNSFGFGGQNVSLIFRRSEAPR